LRKGGGRFGPGGGGRNRPIFSPCGGGRPIFFSDATSWPTRGFLPCVWGRGGGRPGGGGRGPLHKPARGGVGGGGWCLGKVARYRGAKGGGKKGIPRGPGNRWGGGGGLGDPILLGEPVDPPGGGGRFWGGGFPRGKTFPGKKKKGSGCRPGGKRWGGGNAARGEGRGGGGLLGLQIFFFFFSRGFCRGGPSRGGTPPRLFRGAGQERGARGRNKGGAVGFGKGGWGQENSFPGGPGGPVSTQIPGTEKKKWGGPGTPLGGPAPTFGPDPFFLTRQKAFCCRFWLGKTRPLGVGGGTPTGGQNHGGFIRSIRRHTKNPGGGGPRHFKRYPGGELWV